MKAENVPAFPFVPTDNSNAMHLATGMTLRDWFAGQALAGIGSWCPYGSDGSALVGSMQPAARAKWAYEQADALLAQREEKL